MTENQSLGRIYTEITETVLGNFCSNQLLLCPYLIQSNTVGILYCWCLIGLLKHIRPEAFIIWSIWF